MRDETRDTVGDLAERLAKLEAFWGVRLASVADRVARPFTEALEQDELEALIEPAVTELVGGADSNAGARLEERAERCLGLSGGSGVEIPDWLERFGQAVDRALERADAGPPQRLRTGVLPDSVPWLPMSWDELRVLLAQ